MLRVWPPIKVLISFLLQNQVSLSDTLSTSNNLQPKKMNSTHFSNDERYFLWATLCLIEFIFRMYRLYSLSFRASKKKSKKKEEDKDVTMVFRSFLLIFLQTQVEKSPGVLFNPAPCRTRATVDPSVVSIDSSVSATCQVLLIKRIFFACRRILPLSVKQTIGLIQLLRYTNEV